MHPRVRTLYLLPHSHTDIGYSHDPVVAMELHLRFLDRAIALCEATRHTGEGERFRWTVEVFFTLLHWWEHRGPEARARLLECLRRGEIDIGARYLNGTECHSPGDVAWEMGELERLRRLTGFAPRTAIQNDVNGFPYAFASRLARAGVEAVVMGLNTTMGHTPMPRCTAFRWQTGSHGPDTPDAPPLLVWNGWIYNRMKSFCHLDRLAEELPARLPALLEALPEDYPYDFAAASATMGDNVGPFPALPEAVRRFNESRGDFRIRLATFSEFTRTLAAAAPADLPVHRGHWPDFWTFGSGSMPPMIASMRRAQRRLERVERFRELGWAEVSGGTLHLDAARRALALACEHTYESHSSAGEHSGSPDSLRQRAQVQAQAAFAESASMVLLRDHLAAMAAGLPHEPVSVLAVNPSPWPLTLDYRSDRKGLLRFAASRRPEHLFQFDREPTREGLAAPGRFGALDIPVPPRDGTLAPLGPLPPPDGETLAPCAAASLAPEGMRASLRYDPQRGGLIAWKTPAGDALAAGETEAAFEPVLERPSGPFQYSGDGMEGMDPSDCRWSPDLLLRRTRLPAKPVSLERRSHGARHSLRAAFAQSPLTLLEWTLDSRHPHRLEAESRWRFDTDPAVRAFYLALPVALPGEGDCDYWVDACGHWFRAGVDQIPGTCTTFYHAWSGVAVSRGGRTLYVAAADTPLFQCGGFTFARDPALPPALRKPFLALWIYNNYWETNFPAAFPAAFRARFRLEYRDEAFRPETAARLAAGWDSEDLTHPVA